MSTFHNVALIVRGEDRKVLVRDVEAYRGKHAITHAERIALAVGLDVIGARVVSSRKYVPGPIEGIWDLVLSPHMEAALAFRVPIADRRKAA